jgi:hypothetical protein
VTAVRVWLVSVLVTVTLAFGTTDPVGSVTVPVSAPVPADWASSADVRLIKLADSSKAPLRENHDNFMDVIVVHLL